jgi:hypothetical protein
MLEKTTFGSVRLSGFRADTTLEYPEVLKAWYKIVESAYRLVINHKVNNDVGGEVDGFGSCVESWVEADAASDLEGWIVESMAEATNQTDDLDAAIGAEDDLDDGITLDMVLLGVLGIDGLRFEGNLGRSCSRDRRSRHWGTFGGSSRRRTQANWLDGSVVLSADGAGTITERDSANGLGSIITATHLAVG